MKIILFVLLAFLISDNSFGQSAEKVSPTPIMTLGVFHFAYHNLDVVKTKKKDMISVLDEPYQSEIRAICKSICEFNPTIIAIEQNPESQLTIDSLYQQYKLGKFQLKKSEVFQLAFRIGKQLNLDKIVCVNNMGKHYKSVESIFNDSIRISKFTDYYNNSHQTKPATNGKVSSIVKELYEFNRPELIRERLAIYLSHPFKYEEQEGDFTGVDFETGRWYNRNLRILRNIQRIQCNEDDRILLIIGREHLNLLNLFLDISKEYELISPLPYLKNL